MRRFLWLTIVGAVIVTTADDAGACGDKFLRMGHSIRPGRYVPVYPATVLLYTAPGAAATRVVDLQKILTAAGHTVIAAGSHREAANVIASTGADILLASPAEARQLVFSMTSPRRLPDLVPVLIRPTKAEIAAADAVHGCVLAAPADHRNRALAEIDCQMERRVKGAAR